MGKLIDGKSIAQTLNQQTAENVRQLKKYGITPKLTVILVGNHKPSETYVKRKEETAHAVGIDFELHRLPHDISQNNLLKKVLEIQNDPHVSGLIVQLPLPKHIDQNSILNAVKPEIDVDCLTDEYFKKLEAGNEDIIPPTPGAVLSILDHLNIDVQGKKITILGKGMLVGKPLALIFRHKGALVTVCDSTTTDTKEKCLMADIIVSGVGKKDMVRGDMIKKGAIVIDAGTSFEGARMYGDINVDEVISVAAYVTPTPGGVGPLTVTRLLMNTLISAQKKYNV